MLAASSGPDLQQIIFVVVFIVIGLVQWLYKLWQEKTAHAERERQPPPSAEEQEARRRAWEEQNRKVEDAVPHRPQPSRPHAPPAMPHSPTAPAPAPGGLGELIDTFRKAMEEAQNPKPAAPPPPLPAPAPRAPVRPQPEHQHVPIPATPSTSVFHPHPQPATASASSITHAPAHVPKSPVTGLGYEQRARTQVGDQRRAHSLTAYLRSTGGYRKAFILKEVLDAPKALQKSPWPVD